MSEVPGLERSRPNSPDAERGLVACLLLDDEGQVATRCLEEGLRPEAFYTPALQLIYAAYMSLLEEGRGLDMVTINERLTESGDAEQTGGFPALTRISMAVETTAHARAWIKLVRDRWLQRQQIRLLEDALEAAWQPSLDFRGSRDAVLPMLTELNGLANQEFGVKLTEVTSRIVEETRAELAGEVVTRDRSRVIPIGLSTADQWLTPLNPMEQDFLVVLCGKKSVGKSALARQIARSALWHEGKKTVLGFLLETTRYMWVRQMAGAFAPIDVSQPMDVVRAQRDGEVRLERFRQAVSFLDEIAEERMFLFEDIVYLDDMLAKADLIVRRTGRVDLIIVDYLQLVQLQEREGQRYQELERITQSFKQLAKRLQCPLLLLAAVNLSGSVRESGGAEYDADRIWLLEQPLNDQNDTEQREKIYGPDGTERGRQKYAITLKQTKARDKPRGQVWVNFWPELVKFTAPPSKKGRSKKQVEIDDGEFAY